LRIVLHLVREMKGRRRKVSLCSVIGQICNPGSGRADCGPRGVTPSIFQPFPSAVKL